MVPVFYTIPRILHAKVALAWFLLEKLDFPRTSGIWHPLVRCLSPQGAQENWCFSKTTTRSYFYRPCIWQSLVRCLPSEKYRNSDFSGVDFWTCFRTQRSCLVRQWIQFRAVCGFVFQRMLGSPVDSKFASVRVRISAQYLVRQWIHGLPHFVHSSEPLVSGRHLFSVRLARDTRIWSFWEMTFSTAPGI